MRPSRCRENGGGGVELLTKCTAITRGGTRCKGIAIDSSDYCYAHHPDRADDRKRAAQKGGKAGGRGRLAPSQEETQAIKALLENLTDRVLEGELPTGVVAVANQLINTRLRAIEQERKVRELEDVLARLDALEEKQRQTQGNLMKGTRRW